MFFFFFFGLLYLVHVDWAHALAIYKPSDMLADLIGFEWTQLILTPK